MLQLMIIDVTVVTVVMTSVYIHKIHTGQAATVKLHLALAHNHSLYTTSHDTENSAWSFQGTQGNALIACQLHGACLQIWRHLQQYIKAVLYVTKHNTSCVRPEHNATFSQRS